MPVKAVVFDLDGTIASFNLDYMTVRSDVRGYLIKQGLPASVLSSNESIFDMLEKTEIFLKNSGKSDRTVNKIRNEALAIAEGYELEAAKTTGMLPGVVETLETLKKMGLKLGLCTINSEKSTNYILKRFGITKFFEAVIPRNKVKYVKPNIEHLEAALKALKVGAGEALLVGDGTRDMQCAKELKVIAVGLPTEVPSQKELIASGADYLITSITDLPMLIETIRHDSRKHKKTSVRESAVTGI
jgi:HAD superfamily hydrolase (TIGR01549 family)